MAGMCCGVNIGETEATAPVEPSSKSARRRRMEIHQFNFVPTDSAVAPPLEDGGSRKRQKMDAVVPVLPPRECVNAVENCEVQEKEKEKVEEDESQLSGEITPETTPFDLSASPSGSQSELNLSPERPKFGMTSVCGRRRDMEDAVAIHPSFCGQDRSFPGGLHFFGVYDGHGCSHVATRCKDRMHEIRQKRLLRLYLPLRAADPQCDAVGSTAVVAVVTPDKIVVSNCGDSRAVLCRNGVAIPLSVDHKPDRPDELNRIQEAGGRVIFWDGPRVLGVLAMSRAIGDNYLKPYVISEPEVTITERTEEDECLILASDGLWDVVSNETACGVARMCLQSRKPPSPPRSPGNDITVTEAGESSDKACSDASILLTKLALARHSTDNVSVVVVDLRRS
ncbi:UNVERIFIED_CONTAM: protein phosphatase 2C 37 [Sesamum calycinum]|uniref:protein-serine/threonine phosphatase n=1 Tax=Sesamum calycinum TaxID=2727403 RepID=A0AAW2KG29_9LAMI